MPTKKIYMWIVKEMGKWRYLGRFTSIKQYNRTRSEFVLSCPTQLRELVDEQHFQKTVRKLSDPTWDHHIKIQNKIKWITKVIN